MKFLTTIALTTVALVMAGCTANEETEAVSVPLSFSASVYAQTRAATELTTDNLASAGVFAFFTQGDFNASTAAPNFMYNQKLEKSGGAWTYSPERYWPNNENDKISFFAYAPYNAAGVTISSNTNKGFPYLNYIVPTVEANHIDLLAATPLMNCTKDMGSVNFTMQHMLTKVTIYAKSGDLAVSKAVNNLSLTTPKSGTLTYKADSFGWVSSADVSTITATKTEVTIPSVQDDTVLLGTFYLIPDRKKSLFNITYTFTGNISDNVNPPTNKVVITDKAFPDIYDWTPGASIAYTLNIKATTLEITAEKTDMEWENNTTDEILFFEADDLKIGDYYYSDGTYSDGGLRVLENGILQIYTTVEPVSGKTCVAIVFYVGRHPSDTGVYINKNGNPMEVQGYAVALRQTDKLGHIGWGGPGVYSNTSTDIEDYNGYSNTLKIKEAAGGTLTGSGGVPACYNWSGTVPNTTSGWFCPSAGQLHYIALCYPNSIQKSMSKVGGEITGGEYHHLWSSTEPVNNGGAAYMVAWPSGGIGPYGKGGWVAAQAAIAF